MHAYEQNPCTSISSAAKRALTCSWQQLNDTHWSLLRSPRAVRIVRWREGFSEFAKVWWQVTSTAGAFMRCSCSPRLHLLHLFTVVAWSSPLFRPTKPSGPCLVSHIMSLPTRASTFYYIAFKSRMTQRSFCAVNLMQPSTSTLTHAVTRRSATHQALRHRSIGNDGALLEARA